MRVYLEGTSWALTLALYSFYLCYLSLSFSLVQTSAIPALGANLREMRIGHMYAEGAGRAGRRCVFVGIV